MRAIGLLLLCLPALAWGLRFAGMSRRDFLSAAGVGAAGGLAGLGHVTPAAADGAAKLWISGKSDRTGKDPSDKSGTKKDISYLRCLSNCKAECESPQGGVQRDRGECLQDCQDECCKSYEQCTYTIRE